MSGDCTKLRIIFSGESKNSKVIFGFRGRSGIYTLRGVIAAP